MWVFYSSTIFPNINAEFSMIAFYQGEKWKRKKLFM